MSDDRLRALFDKIAADFTPAAPRVEVLAEELAELRRLVALAGEIAKRENRPCLDPKAASAPSARTRTATAGELSAARQMARDLVVASRRKTRLASSLTSTTPPPRSSVRRLPTRS